MCVCKSVRRGARASSQVFFSTTSILQHCCQPFTNHSIYTDRVLHDNTMWTRFQVFIRTSYTTTDIYNYLHLESILLSIRDTRKSSYPYYTGCLVKSVTNFENGFLTSKLRNMKI